MHYLGLLFAFFAFLGWGFWDFLIQRTSRAGGIWASTFCVTAAGAIILFPFVFKSIPTLFGWENFWFLLALGAGTLVVGLVTFAALKAWKIAVIEPIMSFELPLTVLLVVLLIREHISNFQMLLIAFVFGGILLVGYTGGVINRRLFEKGALLALLAALLQAGVNFAVGLSSQSVGPIETIWFAHTFVAYSCIVYFTVTQTWHSFFIHVKQHPYDSFMVAMLDNAAWVFYAAATTFIPISFAVTVSEAYIVLTIILGVLINREKLLVHQWIGVAISLASVLVLSAIS